MRQFVEFDGLIGDSLMLTPALRQFHHQNPDVEIVLVAAWDGLTETILRHNPHIRRSMPKDLAQAARKPGDRWVAPSAWDALQDGIARKRPMIDGFAEQLGVAIPSPGEYRLDLVLTEEEREAGRALRETFGPKDRVVLCARHSTSCASNLRADRVPNKCFANEIWCEAAEWLQAQGFVPVAVGGEGDRRDPRYAEWPGPRAYGHPLRTFTGLVAESRATFCVDTGVRFVAAAVGCDLGCLSGHIPTSFVFAPPFHAGHRIVERYCPVEMIGLNRCKELLTKLLLEPAV